MVIATEWEQFRALDLGRLKSLMARPVMVDLRNIYRADEMRRAGFRYVAVGRPASGWSEILAGQGRATAKARRLVWRRVCSITTPS